MIVATAGHVDHGKTSLIRALTGVDTDRLPEEKRRGISIDLGFAYWRPAVDALVGFVDVPGHERFVRNMLAGVCGIDAVLLVVAADDGVMPQTVEHLQIIELLAVERGIAVINKVDRVPAERVAEVAGNLRALLGPTRIANIDILPVSATSGTGLQALRAALAGMARSAARQAQAGRPFRFAVDRAFSIAGAGTVLTGTPFSGSAAQGDKLVLTPSGIPARVRGIQKDGKPAATAVAGERCAINVADVDLARAARGDWLVAERLHAPTQRMDVRLSVLRSEPRPLTHWTPVHLHHGAGDVTARVAVKGEIAPGGGAIAQLVTDEPVAALHGDRFVIRDQSALRTIGGGRVIDPLAPRRSRDRAQRLSQLEAIETDDPETALAALRALSPEGVDMAWFGRVFHLDEQRLAAMADKAGLLIVGRQPPVALPRDKAQAILQSAIRALEAFHAKSPQAAGLELPALRAQSAPGLAMATFQAMLRTVSEVEITGSAARLRRHVATDNPGDADTWRRVQPLLHAAGFNGLTIAELAAAAKIKEPALKDFLFRKAKTGEVVKVSAERFYLRGTLARFAAIAVATSQAAPGGRFSAAQVRDRTGIGRTRVIEILECFDRMGITRRAGDLRTLGRDFTSVLGEK
ncbi:MAG: selenocysteine-specific translation elongation factor [Betaproteobacteria bacterium]